MKYIAMFLSLMFGSLPFALAQSNSGGSAAGQTTTNSSSVQGTAGTNASGTIHTNQGNSYGNNAAGGISPGRDRTNQTATSNATSGSSGQGSGKEPAGEDGRAGAAQVACCTRILALQFRRRDVPAWTIEHAAAIRGEGCRHFHSQQCCCVSRPPWVSSTGRFCCFPVRWADGGRAHRIACCDRGRRCLSRFESGTGAPGHFRDPGVAGHAVERRPLLPAFCRYIAGRCFCVVVPQNHGVSSGDGRRSDRNRAVWAGNLFRVRPHRCEDAALLVPRARCNSGANGSRGCRHDTVASWIVQEVAGGDRRREPVQRWRCGGAFSDRAVLRGRGAPHLRLHQFRSSAGDWWRRHHRRRNWLDWLFGHEAHRRLSPGVHHVIGCCEWVLYACQRSRRLRPDRGGACGLFIGSRGPRQAMSEKTRRNRTLFWSVVDEILNSLLFMLIGFEMLGLARLESSTLFVIALAIPLGLLV